MSDGGTETILVVDDDPDVCRVTATILRRLGYDALEADTAAGALEMAAGRPLVHLLLVDVVLPQQSGRELAARFLELHPSGRVVYVSGHADARVAQGGVDPGVVLRKPLTIEALAAGVRAALDGAG